MKQFIDLFFDYDRALFSCYIFEKKDPEGAFTDSRVFTGYYFTLVFLRFKGVLQLVTGKLIKSVFDDEEARKYWEREVETYHVVLADGKRDTTFCK